MAVGALVDWLVAVFAAATAAAERESLDRGLFGVCVIEYQVSYKAAKGAHKHYSLSFAPEQAVQFWPSSSGLQALGQKLITPDQNLAPGNYKETKW